MPSSRCESGRIPGSRASRPRPEAREALKSVTFGDKANLAATNKPLRMVSATVARPTPLTQYTHILFDHDGVLVDTEPLYYQATKECLAPLGVELALDHYLALMVDGASPWEMARPLGATDADIEHWRAKRNLLYQEMLASEPIEIEGVEEILAKLREHYRIAIVTTAKPEDFALIHRHRNIVPHTDFVLTREAYQRSKPHPDPYLAALARYGISPSVALAVEDSQRGLRAAVAAGLDCAVVHHPFTASQDFSLATYRVASLAELASEILGSYPNLSMVE